MGGVLGESEDRWKRLIKPAAIEENWVGQRLHGRSIKASDRFTYNAWEAVETIPKL